MTIIPIDESDVAPARALRAEFARFWSTAQGTPRDIYDQFTNATPTDPGVTGRDAGNDPGPGWWSQPKDAIAGQAILFIHGGGYGLGHASGYIGFISQIAARTRTPVFALEYPLAPEATLPTAFNLAVETLARLTAQFASVAVVGDSAGGGLSLATVLEARKRDIPVAALVVFSPWTDLSLSGDSARELAVSDPLLDVSYLRASAAAYLGGRPATDPHASPLFEPAPRLPPTLIQVGSDEVLLDDSRRMAKAASEAGSQVTLEEWQGMHHVFQLNTRELASARKALDHTATFIGKHWPR